MKIDINKKYTTRDGKEVRIYATDGTHPYPIHGAYLEPGDGWVRSEWMDNGGWYISSNDDCDLIEKPTDKQRLIEHFKDSSKPVAVHTAGCKPVRLMIWCSAHYFNTMGYGDQPWDEFDRLATKEEVLSLYLPSEGE